MARAARAVLGTAIAALGAGAIAVAIGQSDGSAAARPSGMATAEHGQDGDHLRQDPRRGPVVLEVSWHDRPQSVRDMVMRSETIVEGEVVDVQAGGPLLPPPGTPDPVEATIPTQRITLRVIDQIDGSKPATVTIFRTGDGVTSLEGDPQYALGENYVLFLARRRDSDNEYDGTYLPVGPDGRLAIRSDGRARKLIDGPVGADLDNLTKQEIRTRVKQAKETGR